MMHCRFLRVSVLVAAWFTVATARSEERLNVVLILADDMGWNDAGFGGSKVIDTPNLNRLAAEGTVFAQACASAPNCAPTRACLLTGQYPPRHGVYTVVDERHAPGSPHHRILAAESRESMPTESVTLAEALKPAGYATGMFGMWNLGRGQSGPTTPTGQGFDEFTEPKELGFAKDAYRDAAGRYSPDVLTDAALRWMESVKGRPFFLYLPFHDVHAPYDPKPELLAKYEARKGVADPAHAATVEAMDTNVGRVMSAIEASGAARRTLVIFTSDNGGTRQYVAPLRGGKGTLYQGGVRVPAVVRGPGIKAGSVSQVPVLSMDWFPTVLALTGVKAPDGVKADGLDLAPVLTGAGKVPGRDLFWHFPCYIGGGGPCSAIRSGDWKLMEFFESKTTELYHLADDPGEERDLSESRAEMARALLERLRAWQKATSAPCPGEPNPEYDPKLAPRRGREERGKGGGNGQTKQATKKSAKP
jgi:arylsulfatase A-like enzyme